MQELETELKVLGRLLYRNKNQHRRTRYFQLANSVQKSLTKWTKNLNTEESLSILEKNLQKLIECAGCLSQLIAQELFLPFTLVALAIISKIRLLVLKEYSTLRYRSNLKQEIGECISRSHINPKSKTAHARLEIKNDTTSTESTKALIQINRMIDEGTSSTHAQLGTKASRTADSKHLIDTSKRRRVVKQKDEIDDIFGILE